MRFIVLNFIIVLLIISSVVADYGNRPNVIVSDINRERNRYKLEKIKYNHTVQNKLEKWRNNRTADWFYQESNYSRNVSVIERIQRQNGMFLMNMEGWEDLRKDGWTFGFRDTYTKYIDVIIRYRNNQRGCFNVKKCSDKFSDYFSCLKNMPKVPIEKDNYEKTKCAWAPYYYYRYVNKLATQIACVSNKYRTPYVPKGMNQPYSFHCYIKYKGHMFISDIPNL